MSRVETRMRAGEGRPLLASCRCAFGIKARRGKGGLLYARARRGRLQGIGLGSRVDRGGPVDAAHAACALHLILNGPACPLPQGPPVRVDVGPAKHLEVRLIGFFKRGHLGLTIPVVIVVVVNAGLTGAPVDTAVLHLSCVRMALVPTTALDARVPLAPLASWAPPPRGVDATKLGHFWGCKRGICSLFSACGVRQGWFAIWHACQTHAHPQFSLASGPRGHTARAARLRRAVWGAARSLRNARPCGTRRARRSIRDCVAST